MERRYKEITTLADDLDCYFQGWSVNPHVTEAQRRVWPRHKLPHMSLGTDAPDYLRLLAEDGFDGLPVSSRRRSAVRKWFYNEDHLSPPLRDLARFCIFFHIGFFGTVQLLGKKLWEDFVIEEKKKSIQCGSSYSNSVTTFDDTHLTKLLFAFRHLITETSASHSIFLLLEEHGQLASRLGFDAPRLANLLDQLIYSRCLYVGTNGQELQEFVARQEQELVLLGRADQELAQQHWIMKCRWSAMQDALDELVMEREDIRLKNHGINMQWMREFGKEYIELLDARSACLEMEMRIAIRQERPAIMEEELNALVRQSMKNKRRQIEKAREDACHSAFHELFGCLGEPITMEDFQKQREQAMRVLREIFHLTHEDKLQSLGFTERQKKELEEYFQRVLQIRNAESGLDMRALPVLTEILGKVKRIYELMGIDIDPQGVIHGETLDEQIKWLESEIHRMERQSSDLRAQILAMGTDPDIREKKTTLASDTIREETLQSLRKRTQEFQEKLTVLSQQYQDLKGEGGVQ